MAYNPAEIEKKWQKYWQDHATFAAKNQSSKPKYYVLDMFPYPSGAGLHIGHPLGYIASDIIARYKRLEGYNVLHPLGYDSFGLPAEQYAIQTGQHPAITTETNIAQYEKQLRNIGLSFDWDRKIKTSDPNYYRWTQWIFAQLFDSWYNLKTDKAESIDTLMAHLKQKGTQDLEASQTKALSFTSEQWKAYDQKQQSDILLNYRLTYLGNAEVNWCPELGSVLANDEVKDGVSERGGHPIEKRQMIQWIMRITAYNDRLLDGLDHLDWSSSLKESQRNWIGKSKGCSIVFDLETAEEKIEVFSTRPDTLFGASFMVLAPEHKLVDILTPESHREAVDKYRTQASKKSERQRQEEAGTVISGEFIGAYALHPISRKKVPIWIADYVLMGYGTGAVMAVPAHDERDHRFAKHFDLPIIPVIQSEVNIQQEAYVGKTGKLINSDFLDGLEVKEAIEKMIATLEKEGKGKSKINYKLRDAVFSRQRFWGEPFPVYYENGIPKITDEFPVELPQVDKYLPTSDGEPPLARATNWDYKGLPYEKNTMPGWAGSSWYFLRYMSPQHETRLVEEKAEQYWREVDLYIGGAEHATGHLIYARFWNKFLKDRGFISQEEPFKKLVNQGMILNLSAYIFRVIGEDKFISAEQKANYDTTPIPIDISMVNDTKVDLEKLKQWRPDFQKATYVFGEEFHCERELEKMSKSKYNVINPDEIIAQYGADTFRLYEMFLGPLTQHKPWKTEGMNGVANFLKKLWKLFFDGENLTLSEEKATPAELKSLHTLIKKVQYDIENLSLNTTVSAFMIAVNELGQLECNKREILEPLLVLISPYAPFIAEELWEKLGHSETISYANLPKLEEKYLVETSFEYPVCINGKMKHKLNFALNTKTEEIQTTVLADEKIKTLLKGKNLVKFILVPKKIINLVVK